MLGEHLAQVEFHQARPELRQMPNWRWQRDCNHPTTGQLVSRSEKNSLPPEQRRPCLMREHRAYVSCVHMQQGKHDIDQADHLQQRQIQQRLMVS
jgi:hypothetical protein